MKTQETNDEFITIPISEESISMQESIINPLSSNMIFDAILSELKCIKKTTSSLKEELSIITKKIEVLEKNNEEVSSVLVDHIGFINGKYETYRTSLDYIKDKVTYFINPKFSSYLK